MSRGRVGGVGLALAVLVISCARPVVQPPTPAPRDLVVLAPDPETGEVGRLAVTSASQTVDLIRAGESTTVVGSQPPGPVVTLDDAEIQRVFGAAIALQPPGAEHFNLYFELGADTLTPESKALVTAVIASVQGRAAPEVTAIGHTDTTGTTASNAALGLQRASLIRDLLIQAGIEPTIVDVVSHGESDPLIPTPDNTAEARNRRVEVSVR